MLYKIEVRHIGPKNSHASVETWALADDEAQVVAHVADLAGYRDDVHEKSVTLCRRGTDLEAASARADALGADARLNDWGELDVTATPIALTAITRGTRWIGTENAYYGVTHYWWGDGQHIDDATAAHLVRFGIATDLRAVGGDQ
jgi:hypothetical protein